MNDREPDPVPRDPIEPEQVPEPSAADIHERMFETLDNAICKEPRRAARMAAWVLQEYVEVLCGRQGGMTDSMQALYDACREELLNERQNQ